MRYALRNQQKIKDRYDQKYFERMIRSLNSHFNSNENIEEVEVEGDPYSMILVEDVDHTVNIFFFFVIRKTFDVYHLAFKEAIG